MKTVRVVIFYNVTQDEHGRSIGMMDGFGWGHTLRFVDTYSHVIEPDDTVESVVNTIFRAYNVVDGAADERPIQLGVRSMSVGDVVCVFDTSGMPHFKACAPAGWVDLDPGTPVYQDRGRYDGDVMVTTLDRLAGMQEEWVGADPD